MASAFTNLEELALHIQALRESAVSAFLFHTDYDEDLDRLIQWFTDHGIIDAETGILEMRQAWIGSQYKCDDIFSYKPSSNLDKNPQTSLLKDPAIKNLRANYKENALDSNYLGRVIEILSNSRDTSGRMLRPLLVIRRAEHLLSDPIGWPIIRALARVCHAAAERREDHLTVFMTASASLEKPFKTPTVLLPYLCVEEIPPLAQENIFELMDEHANMASVPDALKNKLALYLSGFRKSEIRRILSYATQNVPRGALFTNEGQALLKVINSEKKQILLKNGSLLEWVKEQDKQVGGLTAIKEWLEDKALIYQHFDIMLAQRAILPKGVLIAGLPGSGKSLMAQVAQSIFRVPLLKMDIGRLMGGLVGESEANMHRALSMVRDMSPCVLWVDELEKAFAGADGSGHEVTMRLFGSFLNWMQDKDYPCFIIATANKLSKLPPEFFRKGRFDEKFYTFMPDCCDCINIFKVCIRNQNTCLSQYEMSELNQVILRVLDRAAHEGQFMTGADIQSIVTRAFELLFLESFRTISDRGTHEFKVCFSLDELYKKLLSALASTRTFAQTDLDGIVSMWLEMRNHNFLPAMGEQNILPFIFFDPVSKKYNREQLAGTSCEYDIALQDTLIAQLEK